MSRDGDQGQCVCPADPCTTVLRWRIERDFEEFEQELGLGHFEGRGWRGFHHHASLCVVAYGFLVAERCRSSPRAGGPGSPPPSGRPATGPAAPPVRPERPNPLSITTLRGHLAGGAAAPTAPMPLLLAGSRATAHARQFMTP